MQEQGPKVKGCGPISLPGGRWPPTNAWEKAPGGHARLCLGGRRTWQKENRVHVPVALNLAWGCMGLFSCRSANTPRCHPSCCKGVLRCIARLFVTIFESPVQRRQWRGEREEDRTRWKSQSEIGIEEIWLTSAKGPTAPRNADGSGQEREFMGSPYVAGSLGFPDPYSYKGTACSRLVLRYLRAISITTVPQGREEQGPAVHFANFLKKKKKVVNWVWSNFSMTYWAASSLGGGSLVPHVSITGCSSAINRECGRGAGTAAFQDDRYIPVVKGAHYVCADRKVSDIRSACAHTLPPWPSYAAFLEDSQGTGCFPEQK